MCKRNYCPRIKTIFSSSRPAVGSGTDNGFDYTEGDNLGTGPLVYFEEDDRQFTVREPNPSFSLEFKSKRTGILEDAGPF
ncbi:hypothetical protein CGZ90_18695 [Fictibacillus aquaticus]|uniref:Uncharacterized protein n=1 Tax=Fictibacillus aquaticus TaxID=2021314 RepID=A0A235F4R9_9BACL|nr:hypothetical protein CGZ90_18695 [Fictibacillus aquaticus]